MTFEFHEHCDDTAAALRACESQAPKQMKELVIRAAVELEDFHRVSADAARELDEAASMRIGQMDSLSRADEVSRQVRTTLASVASRLRALVNKGENDVRRT